MIAFRRLALALPVLALVCIAVRRRCQRAYEAGRMEQYRFWNTPYSGISVEHSIRIDGRDNEVPA
jgi:hypothetical protein